MIRSISSVTVRVTPAATEEWCHGWQATFIFTASASTAHRASIAAAEPQSVTWKSPSPSPGVAAFTAASCSACPARAWRSRVASSTAVTRVVSMQPRGAAAVTLPSSLASATACVGVAMIPAAYAAATSPMEWPTTRSGNTPHEAHRSASRMLRIVVTTGDTGATWLPRLTRRNSPRDSPPSISALFSAASHEAQAGDCSRSTRSTPS
mmetsp:Transcript_14410/g.35146  ORF Transcript_14410/g.35146 Transcript_14410/m.35146 type:complete len:208 (+) Transcript_14410:4037-4660(+)